MLIVARSSPSAASEVGGQPWAPSGSCRTSVIWRRDTLAPTARCARMSFVRCAVPTLSDCACPSPAFVTSTYATGIVATSFPLPQGATSSRGGWPSTGHDLGGSSASPSVRECRRGRTLVDPGVASHLRRALHGRPARNREGLPAASGLIRPLPAARGGSTRRVLLVGGLALTWGDPTATTAAEEHYSYWRDNRGQHQISGLLLAPLVSIPAWCLSSEQAIAQPRARRSNSVRRRRIRWLRLAAGTFALVGMLEVRGDECGTRGESGKPRTRSANFTPTIGWRNAAFAAVLLATGLGVLRN